MTTIGADLPAQLVAYTVLNYVPPLGVSVVAVEAAVVKTLRGTGRASQSQRRELTLQILGELCENIHRNTPRNRPTSATEWLIQRRISHTEMAATLRE
ncbi:MAG TPA: hypothetical protein VIJ18_04715 [Microbacteriaceae bacterium]